MDDPYDDIEGGGRALVQKPKKKTAVARHDKQLSKFKERLHELGWRRSFIERHVADYVGEELDDVRETVLIEEHT